MKRTLLLMISASLMTACGDDFTFEPAERIARDLVVVCPDASLNNESARDACADGIARSAVLFDYMDGLIRWGRIDSDASFDPQANDELTKLGSLTARRAYLSMFQFQDEGTIEQIDDATIILRMPVTFRNAMELGAYPEPFWWDANVWDAYQQTTEIVFTFIDERIVAIYMSGRDPERASRDPGPLVTDWTWVDDHGVTQPYAAQFSYLFSSDNPYAAELEETADGFFYAMRSADCTSCHVPSNPGNLRHVGLLNYPNQTLGLRERLVYVFEERTMPPAMPLEDHVNEDLLRRAIGFDIIADLAIAYEAP